MGQLLPPPDDDNRRRRRDDDSPGDRPGNRRTEFPPLDLSRPLGVVVPDDLSDLEDEVRAVQQELGIAALGPRTRRARLRSWLLRRAGVRRGSAPSTPSAGGLARSLLVGPVVAALLLVVAGLVALFPPSPPQSPRRSNALPQLATPLQPIGAVGGLLPEVGLVAGPTEVSSRSLRPGVLMLVPDRCACPDLVHQMIGQVEEYPGLTAALVGSGRDPGVAESALARAGGDGRLPAFVDRNEVLAGTYHAGQPGSAPTVLFVAGDGILTQPPLVFTPGTRIEGALLPLVSPVR